MSSYAEFLRHFFHALSQVWEVIAGLLVLLLTNAAAVAYFESMPFGDALYFSSVTGLTVGYGDIAPVSVPGRSIAVLIGLVGVLISGLVVAVAVYALRETVKPRGDGDRV